MLAVSGQHDGRHSTEAAPAEVLCEHVSEVMARVLARTSIYWRERTLWVSSEVLPYVVDLALHHHARHLSTLATIMRWPKARWVCHTLATLALQWAAAFWRMTTGGR